MKVVHFASAAEFRQWLETHHAISAELHVGFYKKASGRSGLTYKESVDEALCFGWIDGIVRRIDADSFTHRFTPRKPRSIWSNINVAHVARLTAAGQMRPAGLAAFAAREAKRTGVYAFEQKQQAARPQKFPTALEKIFRAEPSAWAHWKLQPPGYQRTVIWWVTSAKQAATREARLAKLIALSVAGRRVT